MKNMSYSKLRALEANTAAIETAYQVRSEKRTATAAERETLSLYSGFGGIKEVLDLGTVNPMPDKMTQALDRLLGVLQSIAQGDETLYKELVGSIKASVLTAFYTPKFLIEAVANQIQATFQTHGLQMKSFLEPSAGIGGFLPVAMPGTYKAAFEKDLATGLVLSALQPDTQTVIDGFETIGAQELEHGTFDVIASNIPFGTINVFDADFERRGTPYKQSLKAIHNYFFIKAMELLNEGGLLAFVTSRGVADSPTNRFVRDYLVHHAHIITALRLPDTLFMQTGGIEVGSDLIILQKDSRKQNLTTRERLFWKCTGNAHRRAWKWNIPTRLSPCHKVRLPQVRPSVQTNSARWYASTSGTAQEKPCNYGLPKYLVPISPTISNPPCSAGKSKRSPSRVQC